MNENPFSLLSSSWQLLWLTGILGLPACGHLLIGVLYPAPVEFLLRCWPVGLLKVVPCLLVRGCPGRKVRSAEMLCCREELGRLFMSWTAEH